MPSLRTSPPGRRAEPVKDRDVEQALRDALNLANTDLNTVTGERDRFETSCSQLKKRVTDSQTTIQDLGSQLQTLHKDRDNYKKQYQQSEENYKALGNIWVKRYAELEEKYNNLFDAYNELKATFAHHESMTASLPDRTKDPRSPVKESRDDRGRGRDKDREREREKEREKEREREKRDKKAAKAEKERLSKRFDNRPPTSNRRSSFVEGRSHGSRSASANPASRTYTATTTTTSSGRTSSTNQHGSYANHSVPRTPNPLSPSGAYSSSSSSGMYDDDGYEDGNYHAHPIPR